MWDFKAKFSLSPLPPLKLYYYPEKDIPGIFYTKHNLNLFILPDRLVGYGCYGHKGKYAFYYRPPEIYKLGSCKAILSPQFTLSDMASDRVGISWV